MKRVAIVFDGEEWFVRRIRTIEHDLALDEKVYHCDRPIGRNFKTLAAASKAAKKYMAATTVELRTKEEM